MSLIQLQESMTRQELIATQNSNNAFLNSNIVFIAADLQNGWVEYGGPIEIPGYGKISPYLVMLRGTMKNGTTTNETLLFTLPVGFRPLRQIQPVCATGTNNTMRLNIYANGEVKIGAGANSVFLALDGIIFSIV